MPRTRREGKSGQAITVDGISGERLKVFLDRIERLEEEKRSIGEDIKEIFAEAKGQGFDTKLMRMLLKERRMDPDDLKEQNDMLDVYRRALGMFVDTPLGEAAMRAAEEKVEGPNGEKLRKKKDEEPVAVAAVAEVTPDDQAEAKLKGEAAGASGEPITANPHPGKHALHSWWSKGWHLGKESLAARAAELEPVPDKVTPIRGKGKAKEGYIDKTPRMSAAEAAAALAGAPEAPIQ